ncbi:MAG: thiamine diphosphokinase [Clostridiales bacterium]|nr:thiamine diphosphokinase [Clostridiales bacterium]
MRAVIFGNGDIQSYERAAGYLKADDFIICADGGLRHAKKMGLRCDVLIGDFDSLDVDADAGEIIQYPAKKDFTDGELCVKYAREHGFSDIILLGMTGKRLDHTINNIMMLSCCGGTVIDDDNEIYILKDSLEFYKKKGRTLSIIPVGGNIEGIDGEGVEYPLCNDTLHFGSCRGSSNVIVEEYCKITIKSGVGLVVITDGK